MSEENVNRKVFICKSCSGVYADEPVTQCDCMPENQEFYEMRIVPLGVSDGEPDHAVALADALEEMLIANMPATDTLVYDKACDQLATYRASQEGGM